MSTKIISVALEGNEHLSDDDRFMITAIGQYVARFGRATGLRIGQREFGTMNEVVDVLARFDVLPRIAFDVGYHDHSRLLGELDRFEDAGRIEVVHQ